MGPAWAETPDNIKKYDSYFSGKAQAERDAYEAHVFSRSYAPRSQATYREKVDTYIVQQFTREEDKLHDQFMNHQLSASEYTTQVSTLTSTYKHAQYTLYDIFDVEYLDPISKTQKEIDERSKDLAVDIISKIPIFGGVIPVGTKLADLADLKIKKSIQENLDKRLPQTEDFEEIYTNLKLNAKKKNKTNAYAESMALIVNDPSKARLDSDLNTLIASDPVIESQIEIAIAQGKINSLEDLAKTVANYIQEQEDKLEKEKAQREEQAIENTYNELKHAQASFSKLVGIFNPKLQKPFDMFSTTVIDIRHAYTSGAHVLKNGLSLTSLSSIATGVGAVFLFADFLMGPGGPNEMQALMENMNAQFDQLNKKIDELHEHMNFIHKDIRMALSEISETMNKKFNDIDAHLAAIRAVLEVHTKKLDFLADFIRATKNRQQKEAQILKLAELECALDDYRDGDISLDESLQGEDISLDEYLQKKGILLDEYLRKCRKTATIESGKPPHVEFVAGENEDDPDYKNLTFHKLLLEPFYKNLHQIFTYLYPRLRNQQDTVKDKFDRLESPIQSLKTDYPFFTLENIKNIETWAEAIAFYQFIALKEADTLKCNDPKTCKKIARHANEFIEAGQILKSSLNSIFYKNAADLKKLKTDFTHLARILARYLSELRRSEAQILTIKDTFLNNLPNEFKQIDIFTSSETQPFMGKITAKSNMLKELGQEKFEEFSQKFSKLNGMLPPHIKIASFLDFGHVEMNFENISWAQTQNTKGHLAFELNLKFIPTSEYTTKFPTIEMGHLIFITENVFHDYSDRDPMQTLQQWLQNNDADTILKAMMAHPENSMLVSWFNVETYTEPFQSPITQTFGGRMERHEEVVGYETKHISKKRETQISKHVTYGNLNEKDNHILITFINDQLKSKVNELNKKIHGDISNSENILNNPFQLLEGQKALLIALTFLGLNQSFHQNKYLQTFFDPMFSNNLLDLSALKQAYSKDTIGTPLAYNQIYSTGLARVKKLSCFLLGRTDGINLLPEFSDSEENCSDQMITDTGLLADRLNQDETPTILQNALKQLEELHLTFSSPQGNVEITPTTAAAF